MHELVATSLELQLHPDRFHRVLCAFGEAQIPVGFDRVADIIASADRHSVLL